MVIRGASKTGFSVVYPFYVYMFSMCLSITFSYPTVHGLGAVVFKHRTSGAKQHEQNAHREKLLTAQE